MPESRNLPARLVQMSGAPGAGKSTMAAELNRRFGMVVLDHDVVKSALLGDEAFANAGKASYRVVLALADQLLSQGFDVVIDSPCFYVELLSEGQEIAARRHSTYLYVECVVTDVDLLDARLRARQPMRSQRGSVDSGPRDMQSATSDGRTLFNTWIEGMKRPSGDTYLRLDTSSDPDVCIENLCNFISSVGSPSKSLLLAPTL